MNPENEWLTRAEVLKQTGISSFRLHQLCYGTKHNGLTNPKKLSTTRKRYFYPAILTEHVHFKHERSRMYFHPEAVEIIKNRRKK